MVAVKGCANSSQGPVLAVEGVQVKRNPAAPWSAEHRSVAWLAVELRQIPPASAQAPNATRVPAHLAVSKHSGHAVGWALEKGYEYHVTVKI